MTIPPPTAVPAAVIDTIAARFGRAVYSYVPLSHPGTSNTIYILGEDLILRVPRNNPARIAGAYTEVVAVQAARAAGVRTPALVAFDDTLELLPVPYGVYERAGGVALGGLGLTPAATPTVWRALGHDLACLHTRVDPDGPAGQVPSGTIDLDPHPWLAELNARGLVTPEEAGWIGAWLDRLESFARAPLPHRFCHGDINASNILVEAETLQYVAVLDWGGAGWCDAVWDFVPVSLQAALLMLEGYRAVAPLDHDETAEARILWHYLQFLIFGLRHGPQHPRARVKQRIEQVQEAVRHFLDTPGTRWIERLP